MKPHFTHKCRNGQVVRERAALLDERDVLDRMIAELKRRLQQLQSEERAVSEQPKWRRK